MHVSYIFGVPRETICGKLKILASSVVWDIDKWLEIGNGRCIGSKLWKDNTILTSIKPLISGLNKKELMDIGKKANHINVWVMVFEELKISGGI